ncbi:galactose-specific lectin nattectin-like [Sebastes fasciatus]|uniref:galactose-specific lectin nattectin-like n=1 Tax=Sebastes fasciatus TaxID=394691 RepID=UPI003D9E2726
MFMLDSAAWTPEGMCRHKYRSVPCRNQICGRGWFQMGNRCLKAFYHNKQLNFQDAENTCRRYGANLVSIHNIVELCQVECIMWRTSRDKAHYWIRLHKTNRWNPYHFTWTDGSGNTDGWTHWAWGQPDLRFWEDCIEMNYWGWGLWNNEDCRKGRPYVCSMKA